MNEAVTHNSVTRYWRDVAWQASGNMLAHVVSLIGIPILSRLYSPTDFAAQSMFLQVTMFAAGVMTCRYEYFVQLPESERDANALQRLVLLLGVSTCVVLTPLIWMQRIWISTILGNPALAPWLALAPVTALLVSLALAAQHRVQRQRDFRRTGLSELAAKTGYVLSGLVGAAIGGSGVGLLTATAAGAVSKLACLTRFEKRHARGSGSAVESASEAARVARRYGPLAGSLLASHLLSTGTTALPIMLISHLYGAATLGQYALVLTTIYLPSSVIGSAIGQVYYQRAANSWARRLPITELWGATARKLFLVGVPIYAAIAILSPYAYPLIFGAQWATAGWLAAWFSIAAFFSFISTPLDRTSFVVGLWWYPMAWHGFRVALTAAVIGATLHWELPVTIFMPALAAQISLAYAVDLLVGWRLSRREH